MGFREKLRILQT